MDWGGGRFLSRLYSSAFVTRKTRLPEYKPVGTDLPLSPHAHVCARRPSSRRRASPMVAVNFLRLTPSPGAGSFLLQTANVRYSLRDRASQRPFTLDL